MIEVKREERWEDLKVGEWKETDKIIVKYFLNTEDEVNFSSVSCLWVCPEPNTWNRTGQAHTLHKHSLNSQTLEAVGLLQ